MKIYLDHNVVVYLREGKDKRLTEKVKEAKSLKHEFVFSPAHLEEIAVSMANGADQSFIDRDIKFLTGLCKKNSLRPINRRRVTYQTEYPIECFQRVLAYYSLNAIAEEIDKNLLQAAKDNADSSPAEISNLDPEVVLDGYYKLKLTEALFFYNLADKIQIRNILHDTSNFKFNEDFAILEASVNLAANWLEEEGFHREKFKKYRSRLHDVSHIIYASYCSVFVSNDKKLIFKAKAIYAFLELKTKVMTVDEFNNFALNSI